MLKQAHIKALRYSQDPQVFAQVVTFLDEHRGEWYTWREIAYYTGIDFTSVCREVETMIATYHTPDFTVVVDPQFNHVAHQWSVLVGFRKAEEIQEVEGGDNKDSDGRKQGELEAGTPVLEEGPKPTPLTPNSKSVQRRKAAQIAVPVPAAA